MYSKIQNHNTTIHGNSSSGLMRYLDKENENTIDPNSVLSEDFSSDENNKMSSENFFTQDFTLDNLFDESSNTSVLSAIQQLDNNRGTQGLNASNFYMINLAPNTKELEHLERIAVEELERRGLILDDIKDSPETVLFFEDQKDQLIKIQLKDYTKDVMNEYAKMMDREIYVNQYNLPSNVERQKFNPEIEERYQAFLFEKGITVKDLENHQFTTINDYKVKQEYPYGKIFTMYSQDLDKKFDLFVSEKNYKITNDILLINEDYFNEKYQNILETDSYDKEQVEIKGKASHNLADFQDYKIEDKIQISEHWPKFDHELKLYFDSKDVELENGICQIPKSVYENKVYEVKSQFLSKHFADEKKEIFDNLVLKEGFNLNKYQDENGKDIYLNPDQLPTKDEMKMINIKASVEFNKFLVRDGYLTERPGLKIQNWEDKSSIQAEIVTESEKARLLTITDERLKEPEQFWVANFAITDKKANTLNLDENGNIKIISEFYEHKINEILSRQNEEKLHFEDFTQIENRRGKLEKNEESILFKFTDTGLKKPLEFNVKIEDLYISKEGEYTMQRSDFEYKYEQHLLRSAEKEFSKDFEKITTTVNAEKLDAKNFIKEREIENRFKDFLVDKKILESKTDNYFVEAKITENKNNSSLICYSPEKNGEEIKLWVNDKMISKSDKEGIYFKNEKQIKNLLDKAIQRDVDSKKLVKIDFTKVEIEAKTFKDEKYNSYTFQVKKEGLSEPIKLSFKESDLKKEGKDFLIEKGKLDYKTENATKAEIVNQFGNVKDDIKNEVWKEKGFDTEKRKITGDDLLYFGKVETERKYSHKDKTVLKNRETLSKIEKLKKHPILNAGKIETLQKQLYRDKVTDEIINEGIKKGGLQHHVHIVTSRHDKTSINPKDKVSMSPNATQRDSKMSNGAKVGFDRMEFFKKQEEIFDHKFGYKRENSEKLETKYSASKNIVKGAVKNSLMKSTGLSTVTGELSKPMGHIKNELMPINIPVSIPKTPLQVAVKVIKLLKSAVLDKGMEM